VCRAVTYAGYIGVLTGVRKGLSISLNYRVRLHSRSSVTAHRFHQLCLLLGHRYSMASHLRHILLSGDTAPSLASVQTTISKLTTSPCYLTFCSPTSILIVEKDLKAATFQTSDDFLAVTNHDREMEGWSSTVWRETLDKANIPSSVRAFLEHSIHRRQCIGRMCGRSGSSEVQDVEEVKVWLSTPPTLNDTTHFSCVMDPKADGGGLVWVQAYFEPLDFDPSFGSSFDSSTS
jgi:hypothetical protein